MSEYSDHKTERIQRWIDDVGVEQTHRVIESSRDADYVWYLLPTPQELEEFREQRSAPKPVVEKRKRCKGCGESLELSKFYRDRSGYKARCKNCYNAARYND